MAVVECFVACMWGLGERERWGVFLLWGGGGGVGGGVGGGGGGGEREERRGMGEGWGGKWDSS